jgi:chaperonin GroES
MPGVQAVRIPGPVPFGDHILIRPVDEDNHLVGGLIAPESGKPRPSLGLVVLVGPGKFTEQGVRLPMEAQAGDLVSYPSFAGQDVFNPLDLPPGNYVMVRQEELYLNHGNKNLSEDTYE